MKKILLFPLFLLLASCTQTGTMSMDNERAKNGTEQVEAFVTSEVEQDYGKAFENASNLQLFLFEDLSTVTFEGEGNEFASYSIKTNWLSESYVRYEQDNGGVILAKYYRVLADGIYLIAQEADETTQKTIEQLEQLPNLSTILISPVQVGTTFDGWTIVAVDAQYKTPYQAFEQVVVLEKQTDSITERHYYVSCIGAIAYEFETTDENGEVSIISSKLASITY